MKQDTSLRSLGRFDMYIVFNTSLSCRVEQAELDEYKVSSLCGVNFVQANGNVQQ